MSEELWVLASISVLFAVYLLAKQLSRAGYCAICAAVSSTWVCMLALYLFGFKIDMAVIAVLMGESVVGLYYLVEKKAKEQLLLFRLPFLLTLTLTMFSVVRMNIAGDAWVFLGALWLFFAILYGIRGRKKIKELATRIIECCKNW